MDGLNRNGLPNRTPLIPKRNMTLGSQNNVLQPNKLKTSRLITNELYKEQRMSRVQNVNNNNGLMNKGWRTKG